MTAMRIYFWTFSRTQSPVGEVFLYPPFRWNPGSILWGARYRARVGVRSKSPVSSQPIIMKVGVDERIVWILLVCFLMTFLVLLACLLCCCWRNFFRSSVVKERQELVGPLQPPYNDNEQAYNTNSFRR